jgi:hypothetical protein
MVKAFRPALFLMTAAALPVGAVYKMKPLLLVSGRNDNDDALSRSFSGS